MDLVQVRKHRQAPVNAVMKTRTAYNVHIE